MTKAEISRDVARETGLTLPQSLKAIDCVFSSITTAIAKGRRVHFRKFGSFSSRKKSGTSRKESQDRGRCNDHSENGSRVQG